jgi:hypothetical protein
VEHGLLSRSSVLRSLVAVATAVTFLATGCAAERPWPQQPVSVATQAFATQGPIATIDVLPLDLQLWAEPGYNVDLVRVRDGTEVNLMSVALDTLARRNYSLGAIIDWTGAYPGGSALTRDELVATVGALSRYGAVAAEHPGQLPVPYLPARLGTTTGADATLYVGGWGYVAEHRDSTGDKVAQGILIGVLIISVVAIIAIIASKSHGGGHGGGGSHGGSSHGGGSHGGGRGGYGGAGAGAGGHSAGGAGGAIGRGAFTASRGAQHVHRAARATEGVIDAFGRAAFDIAISSPDWGENPALPHEGGESQMYLEMTLVDNRTGLALWHAHQTFPASAADPKETVRAARTMLNQLPARAGQPQTAAR